MPHHTVPPDADPLVVVELHIVPPVAMVVLTGDLDLHTRPSLEAMLGAVRAMVVTDLTIDLRAVDFVSLGALGSIAEAAEDLELRGGQVSLLGARPLHRRVLGLLGDDAIQLTE